jgi:Domain of unknown function (DUF4129)
MEGERRGLRTSSVVAAVVACVGVVAVVVLVVFAASGGSVHPVSESTRQRSLPPVTSDEGAGPTPSLTPTDSPAPGWSKQPWNLPEWLGVLVQGAILTAGAIAALLLLRLIVRKVAEIASEVKVPQGLSRDGSAAGQVVSAERLAEAVESGLGTVSTGTPANAIVACWLTLERVAASAGVPRREYETPAEFTVRVLAAADVSQPLLERLAELYREARFSRHDLPESARAEAREALTVLRGQLVVPKEPA